MAAKVKGLLTWCKIQCEGYNNLSVTNFTSSWKSGLAFCAIIHRYRPDLINYDSLSPNDTYGNSKLAFDTALSLGIPALLDPEDMVVMTVPDKLCIITYVSQYYNYFHNKPKGGNQEGRLSLKRASNNSPQVTQPPPEKKILAPISDNKKRGTLEDKCFKCQKKVYIMERQIYEGKLYHRQCIKDQNRSTSVKTNEENQYSNLKRCEKPLEKANPVASEDVSRPTKDVKYSSSNAASPIGLSTFDKGPPNHLPNFKFSAVSGNDKPLPEFLKSSNNSSDKSTNKNLQATPVYPVTVSTTKSVTEIGSTSVYSNSAIKPFNNSLGLNKDVSIASTPVNYTEKISIQVKPSPRNSTFNANPTVGTPITLKIPVESKTLLETSLPSSKQKSQLFVDPVPPSSCLTRGSDEREKKSASLFIQNVLSSKISNQNNSYSSSKKLENGAVNKSEIKAIESPAGGKTEWQIEAEKRQKARSALYGHYELGLTGKTTGNEVEKRREITTKPEGGKIDGEVTSFLIGKDDKQPLVSTSQELKKVTENYADRKAISSHTEKKVVGAHAETKLVGTHAKTKMAGAHVDTKVAGTHAETMVPGASTETKVVGVHVETKIAGAHVDTKAAGTRDEIKVTESHAETKEAGKQSTEKSPGGISEITSSPLHVSHLFNFEDWKAGVGVFQENVSSEKIEKFVSSLDSTHAESDFKKLLSSKRMKSTNVIKRKVCAEKSLSDPEITSRLKDLDEELLVVETEGKKLEDVIRAGTDEQMDEKEEEETMKSWFQLVRKRSELIREESELLYQRRQNILERYHEELEYQYRSLINIPDYRKTKEEKIYEEQLLEMLLKTVENRNEIVDSIEGDRIKYIEEDRQYEELMANSEDKNQKKTKQNKKKEKAQKTKKSSEKKEKSQKSTSKSKWY